MNESQRVQLREIEDNGEFWMSWTEFWKIFTDLTVCSITPDYDSDGLDDGLGRLGISLLCVRNDGLCRLGISLLCVRDILDKPLWNFGNSFLPSVLFGLLFMFSLNCYCVCLAYSVLFMYYCTLIFCLCYIASEHNTVLLV